MPEVKIAFCIPTYKHPHMIAEFLDLYAAGYAERNIDIYIYDSSPDDETKQKVNDCQKEIHSLYYIRIPEKINVYKKIFLIFQQYQMKDQYDFIWPCGDGIHYPLEAIDTILPQLSLQYDMVHINATDREGLGTRVYEDRNEYLSDCAWHTTLLGALLFNCSTMLKDVCWKKYEDRFLKEGYLEFSQVSFYFYRLLELPQFCVKHISGASLCYRSKLKKRTVWYERFFKVLCVDWVNTIETLPDYYTNKDMALLKLGKYSLLETEESLLQKRIDGIYDDNIFRQYKNVFPKLCDIPIDVLKKIAYMTPEQVLLEREKRVGKWQTDLNSLGKKYDGILIYGAGPIARRYARFFEVQNISFSGFVISAAKENTDLLMGYPVYGVKEIISQQKNYGICLGLSMEYHQQVKKVLEEAGMIEQVFFDRELNEYIISEFVP